jgi:hypothetical protein
MKLLRGIMSSKLFITPLTATWRVFHMEHKYSIIFSIAEQQQLDNMYHLVAGIIKEHTQHTQTCTIV